MMNWFYNMKIGTKLLSGFTLVALIAGVIGWVGISNMRGIAAKDTMMYKDMLVPITHLGGISTAFQRVRVTLAKVLLSKNEEDKEKYKEQIATLSNQISQLTGKLYSLKQ